MPATFQKTIELKLQNSHDKFAFLDDILAKTKILADHEKEIGEVLYQLDKKSLAIKLEKCEFAKKEIIWLGFQITPTGITKSKKKCESINKLKTPKKLIILGLQTPLNKILIQNRRVIRTTTSTTIKKQCKITE